MKVIAIFFALFLFETCLSLPISDSSEDISDISSDSDESDESNESDDTIEIEDDQALFSGGKFIKEYVVGLSGVEKPAFDFGIKKGEKSIDLEKPASVNKNSFLKDDSDIEDDDEVESDEMKKAPVESFKRVNPVSEAKPYIRKANLNGPKEVIPFKRIQKPEETSEKELKSVSKTEVKIPVEPVKRPNPAVGGKPDTRTENRAGQQPMIPFKKVLKPEESSEEELKSVSKTEKEAPIEPFKRVNPASEAKPYVRKANREGQQQPVIPFKKVVATAPKEKTPEEFIKEIEELKKEIQRMKVLDQSESEDDDEISSEDDKMTGELIERIKNLRDEIKVEKGIEVESSEEVDDTSSDGDDYFEYSSEEESDEYLDDQFSEESEGAVSSSAEHDAIENIKLVQTFDGENDSSEQEKPKDASEVSGLVKVIQDLKEDIKKQRKMETEEDSEEELIDQYGSDEFETSEESVDEKLLSAFQDLEKNEDLQDIKHFNDKTKGETNQKPFLDIEKPENLDSGEVKIDFHVSNEEANSGEEKVVDLLNEEGPKIPQQVANIELIPIQVISVDLIPVEFPNDFIELVEVVEMSEKENSDINKIINAPKKSDEAKKNVPTESITGGVLSKVGSIFNFMKKQFY